MSKPSIQVYNTLTRKKEPLDPINPPNINMYVCGITPYDEAHLGHARAYITFDTIYRYLMFKGYKVNYIQNITDVDDKIIKKANEMKISIKEVAEKYTESYFAAMKQLNVTILPPKNYPKATEHIADMIKAIETLIVKGHAYEADGDVYYAVKSFSGYGKLSGQNIEAMESGARVMPGERKKDPLDFALWKRAKEGEPSWDSPWGKGRPGWHIECSAMSAKYLGQTFDIHGGGMDLIFPHHENEIAQAEGATGKQFVKYWIHNGFVTINKEKMSKSLKNFFTISEILQKYDGEVIRFALLSTHYRSPIDFSDQLLEDAKKSEERIHTALQLLDEALSKESAKDIKGDISKLKEQFIASMDDDFNTALALAAIFDLVSYSNKAVEQGLSKEEAKLIKGIILELGNIVGLSFEQKESIPADIAALLDKYIAARAVKDYAMADSIRDQELKARGYALSTKSDGSLRVRRI
ncbi:MAG: cysteine--tRNA ligase [bacterium]